MVQVQFYRIRSSAIDSRWLWRLFLLSRLRLIGLACLSRELSSLVMNAPRMGSYAEPVSLKLSPLQKSPPNKSIQQVASEADREQLEHRLSDRVRMNKSKTRSHAGAVAAAANQRTVISALVAVVALSLLQALAGLALHPFNASSVSFRDRLGGALSDQPRRRQSPATFLSHKQNLITGSANTPLTSPYNQFYLTNNVNSPHNVFSSLLTSPWVTPLSTKETCTTASDNRAGICMPKKACLASGGYVAGTCGILGSCCVYQGTCRTIIAANETYFVSPAYPSMHKERLDPPICIFTLQRSPFYNKWPVCQFKLNFDEFSLAPPINGTCGGKTDSFIVSGAVNFNTSGLPTAGICGDMSGQHMYLDVDPERPDDPLLLIVNTANEQRYNRRWSIRVQQIACHSPFRAPNGCLQYYTSESGVVESFNYRGNGRATAFPGSSVLPIRSVPQYPTLQFISSPNYFNDLYYGVCIQKQSRMCAIKWQAIHFDFGGTLAGLSDVTAPNSQTYGCVRHDGLALYGADLGDYVAIQGASRDGRFRLQSQFCGQRLNSLPQQDVNDEIITYAKPFTMIVRSDNLAGLHALPQAPRSQKGFRLKYKQLPCK